MPFLPLCGFTLCYYFYYLSSFLEFCFAPQSPGGCRLLLGSGEGLGLAVSVAAQVPRWWWLHLVESSLFSYGWSWNSWFPFFSSLLSMVNFPHPWRIKKQFSKHLASFFLPSLRRLPFPINSLQLTSGLHVWTLIDHYKTSTVFVSLESVKNYSCSRTLQGFSANHRLNRLLFSFYW